MFLLFVSLAKVANTGSLVTDSVAVNIYNVNIRMYIFLWGCPMKLCEIGRQRSRCWLGGITSDSNEIETFRLKENELCIITEVGFTSCVLLGCGC
jgi:hypothetical protein